MDTSNIYRFNSKDPFDNWTLKDGVLLGYYPRNSLISAISSYENDFKDCGDKGIVGSHISTIGRSCFRKNSRFKVIEIMPGVETIEDYAFYSDIPMLVSLPCTVKCIKKNSFSDNVTIRVERNSYAEKYAKRRGLNIIYRDE